MTLETVLLPIGLFIAGIAIGFLLDWKKMKETNKKLDEMNDLLKVIGKQAGVKIDVKENFKEFKNHVREIYENIQISESVVVVKNAKEDKMTKEELEELAKQIKKQDEEKDKI